MGDLEVLDVHVLARHRGQVSPAAPVIDFHQVEYLPVVILSTPRGDGDELDTRNPVRIGLGAEFRLQQVTCQFHSTRCVVDTPPQTTVLKTGVVDIDGERDHVTRADGEVVVGSTYNGRLFALIEEQKQPVAMLWDWQVFDLDGWVVPSGGKNKAEVMKFLKFATDTQRLADQAKFISYGPTRASSAPLVGKHAKLGIDMAPHMPTDPNNSKTTLLFNYEFWADNRDDLDAKFNAWLLK